jgi:general secretion pathway protein K
VEELKLVVGITPETYRKVQPALTVYSGRQFLDPQFAPKEVLAAVAGANSDAVASALSSRGGGGANAGVVNPSVPLRGRAFSIRTELRKASAPLVREVVVRLTDQPAQPYWVLSWRNK